MKNTKLQKNGKKRIFAALMGLVMLFGLPSALNVPLSAAALGNVYMWTTGLKSVGNENYANSIAGIYDGIGANVTNEVTQEGKHLTAGTKLADSYDLVILVLPYVDLNDDDISVLQAFIDAGGRVVMQAEWPNYSEDENAVLSAAAHELGATFTITNQALGIGDTIDTVNSDSDIMTDVTKLDPGAAAKIDYTQPSVWVAKSEYCDSNSPYTIDHSQQGVWIVDQAASKGRLTIFTDVNFYYEHESDENNIQFFKNLLTNSKDNMKLVKEGKNPNAGFGDGAKATVSNVSIIGSAGFAADTEITVTLKGDTFKAVAADTDASEWINLPKGLSAKVKAAVADAGTTLVIKISGTVTETKLDKVSIVIPADILTGGKAITSTVNDDAKYEAHVCGPLVKVDAVAPTVDTDGNIEYYACACGALYIDAAGEHPTTLFLTVIPKLHSCGPLTKVNAKAATEDAVGNIEYYTCECGKIYSDATGEHEITLADTVIPKHVCSASLTKVAAKAATDKEAGNIEYYVCKCGKVYKDAEGKVEITLASTVVAKKAPQTDDSADMLLWIFLIFISGGVLTTTAFVTKKRKSNATK